jgi:hypothetical protein
MFLVLASFFLPALSQATSAEPKPDATKQITNSIGMKLTLIPSGALTSFQEKKGIADLLLPHTDGTVYNLNAGDAYGKLVDQVDVGGLHWGWPLPELKIT